MTKTLSRRRFSKAAVLAPLALGAVAPLAVTGAAKARVVIIGGGPAGVMTARQLALNPSVLVTLIEPKRTYTTCFFSNLVLGGLRDFESISHSYDGLARQVGIALVRALVQRIDVRNKTLTLNDGTAMAWDRLIVAPGIELQWNAIEGHDEAASAIMPHAYQGGEQTRQLHRAVRGMRQGGLFVLAAPPNPYRCPPGPYERVSMVAQWFSRHNPKAKILIIDAKDKHSKQTLFQRGWERFYPGMVEWLPAQMTDGGVRAVKATSMEVITADETFKADAACIIPAQRAGRIAEESGLADDSGWCPVAADTLASARVEDVYLVGDAIVAGDMPKSAFAAMSQAQVCARAVVADVTGATPIPAQFSNACWSLLAEHHAIKVGASYVVEAGKISESVGFLSALDESDEQRRSTASEAAAWYSGITRELFG